MWSNSPGVRSMQKGTAHADGAAFAGKVYLWTRRHKHALYT
jgi:hypothetical protein